MDDLLMSSRLKVTQELIVTYAVTSLIDDEILWLLVDYYLRRKV